MRVAAISSLLDVAAVTLLACLPSVNADQDSAINVALKASFPSAPFLVELLYGRISVRTVRKSILTQR